MWRLNRWWRATIAISLFWSMLISGIAAYESVTVDPWRFIHEDAGLLFFHWSQHLVYDRSPFGELAIEFGTQRFYAVLLLPLICMLMLAVLFPTLARLIRRDTSVRKTDTNNKQ